jgi:uncharacterized protein
MPLLINLRQLDKESLHLEGKLPVAELDIAGVDELIKVEAPLKYDLEVQKLENEILAQGNVSLDLKCECARCLKPFVYRLELEDWAGLLALEGEEKVVISNDCVDLTPSLREDILLGFPQHPLCKPECGGLPKKAIVKTKKASKAGESKENVSAWAELNKIKFK